MSEPSSTADNVAPQRRAARVCGAAARVLANRALCREHVEIELALPAFPSSQPGQFLQLFCRAGTPPGREANDIVDIRPPGPQVADWASRQAYLRRPFSIADHWIAPDGMAHLAVISRTIGPGTAWLERLRPGDTLNLTGPLGRGFKLPGDDVPIVLIGGGVGVPPLLYLARVLWQGGARDVSVLFGARTHALLPVRLTGQPSPAGEPRPCAALAGGAAFATAITTDDGSLGLRGVVTDALERWHHARAPFAQAPLICACGPEPMLHAVARAARRLGCDCQLCIERMMGCGLGTCLSCVARVRDATRPAGWRWALSCTEGPVFAAEELLDYA